MKKIFDFICAAINLILLPVSIVMQILAIPIGIILMVLPAEFLMIGYFCVPLFCNGRADIVVTYFFAVVTVGVLVAIDIYTACIILGSMWIIFCMSVLDKILSVSFFAFSVYCFVKGLWIWGLFSIMLIPAVLSVCNEKIMLTISKRADIDKCIWSIPAGVAMCYLSQNVFGCKWIHIPLLVATAMPWGATIYKAFKKAK